MCWLCKCPTAPVCPLHCELHGRNTLHSAKVTCQMHKGHYRQAQVSRLEPRQLVAPSNVVRTLLQTQTTECEHSSLEPAQDPRTQLNHCLKSSPLSVQDTWNLKGRENLLLHPTPNTIRPLRHQPSFHEYHNNTNNTDTNLTMPAYDQKKKKDGQIEAPGLTQKEKDAHRRLKGPPPCNEPAKQDPHVERKPWKMAEVGPKRRRMSTTRGFSRRGITSARGRRGSRGYAVKGIWVGVL